MALYREKTHNASAARGGKRKVSGEKRGTARESTNRRTAVACKALEDAKARAQTSIANTNCR